MSEDLYVVELDTRNLLSNDIDGYKESRCNPDFFQSRIRDHPRMVSHQSEVATMCGLNLKLYFIKYKTGLAHHYRRGGEADVMQLVAFQPDLLSSNNGAATFLTTNVDTGLSEHIVCGKAYVVRDEGKYPLSKGQVWGIQEMIHCVMDIYDMDPENMREGRQTLERWTTEYPTGNWEPRSGTGGVDMYSPRRAT
mmetsp:Transcript_27716/g.67459  ORF Transcript_27716/g.67459 Transcript_27716/m.67459 type:complete len:194 (+) Transcript_27716:65-646(+)